MSWKSTQPTAPQSTDEDVRYLGILLQHGWETTELTVRAENPANQVEGILARLAEARKASVARLKRK